MTDPNSPTPAPEPTPRRRKVGRKLKLRWIIVSVLAALVLGGGAYGANAKGNSNAEKYEKAVDEWSDQRNDLLGAPSEANSALWDFDDATTKKSLKNQKGACKRVLTIRKSAAKAAADVPTASNSIFKFLSSDEREAIKDSKARTKAVKAYAKAVDKILVQMHKDCDWNIRVNSVKESDSGAMKIFAEAEKLMLKSGQSEAGYYCPSGVGDCIPATAAKRIRFAELTLKAIKVDKAYVMKKFFARDMCEATSYGDLCGAMKKNLASYYGSVGDYGELFKTIDATSSKPKQEFDQMVKDNKTADKKFKKALFKARPELKSDFRVSKNPFWREAFFSAATVESIVSLDKLRKAVLHVGRTGDSLDALGELNR